MAAAVQDRVMTDESAHTATGGPGSPPGPHAEGPHAAGPPPGAPGAPGNGTPPPGSAAFAARYGLVRPLDGRYLGGVCAAIGRATGTDPVVWRVLLGVLTLFGGLGLLVYLVVLLATPAEGDTAAPVEAMFGRGTSSMSPLTVVGFGAITVIGFGFIVHDSFRAMLLGAAILVAGALLFNRSGAAGQGGNGRPWQGPNPGPGGPGGPPPPQPPYGPPQPPYGATPHQPYGTPPPQPYGPWQQPYGASPQQPGGPQPSPAATGQPGAVTTTESGQPAEHGIAADDTGTARELPGAAETRQLPAAGRLPEIGAGPTTLAFPALPESGRWRDRDEITAVLPGTDSGATPSDVPGAVPGAPTGEQAGPGLSPGFGLPPHSGYRPAFAPHGPYEPGAAPPPLPPLPPPRQPRPSSPLGAATFWMIFVVLGVVAVLELTGTVDVGPSGYFAAVLATIGLGLLVGTWFGRARWLIALGLAAAAALGVAGTTETWGPFTDGRRDVTWTPADYAEVASRYESSAGDAVLDLRGVDFTGQETEIAVVGGVGSVRVYLPPEVDVTAVAAVDVGESLLFGDQHSGVGTARQERTDLGPDGPGGGTLRLDVRLNVGNVEVTR